MSNSYTLTLPWPPSVNSYWRRNGHQYYVSKHGQQFRSNVQAIVLQQFGKLKPMKERLKLWVHVTAPDRRSRDLDNLLKGICDSLQHAGIYESDSQIDDLRVVRGGICENKEGSIVVMVEPITEEQSC